MSAGRAPRDQTASAGDAPAAGPGSVGIVIRTRDRTLFVRRALASVQAQSLGDWQIRLINDGGDAAALDAAIAEVSAMTPFPAGRLQVEHLPASTGRSAAFNRGLRGLETEFVTCLDDDDTWDPAFLESLVSFEAATRPLVPDLGGVMSRLTAIREDVIDEGGGQRIVTLGEDDLPNAFRRRDFFIDPIAYACYRQDMFPVQWMLRRTAALSVGGFPEDFDVMEDRAFMTRFLQRWRMAVLDRPLAFHHRRARRTEDTRRSVDLNSMDNPSYDWRLHAELARMKPHSPPPPEGEAPAVAPELGDLMRAVAASVLREVNDETSALWHKINGEAALLRQRLEALENRLAGLAPPAPLAADPARVAWSLWDRPEDRDMGHAVTPGTRFCDRLEVSQGFDCPGLLVHASKAARSLTVQFPQTRDFTALEVALDGLAGHGGGLACEVLLASAEGYLVETALSIWERDGFGRRRHAFVERHVHACPPGGTMRLRREFARGLLSRSDTPKLSIILPRQASNLRLICRDLVISRI